MTTLAAWASVDSRRLSACYLVSDSRISWGTKSSWDCGQKLFVSIRFPDLFGYCGDVQFPTLALRQVLDKIDQGFLFSATASASERNRALSSELARCYTNYPEHGPQRSTILHVARQGIGRDALFKLWRIDWTRSTTVQSQAIDLPTTSVLGVSLGSGCSVLVERNEKWKKAQGRTARGVFGSFCEAISSSVDPFTGGPPQLVGLYPSGPARLFGVVDGNQRYLAGQLAYDDGNLEGFEWRNTLFERVDPRTRSLLKGAQRQPKPSQIDK
jgi:hypothetical protein